MNSSPAGPRWRLGGALLLTLIAIAAVVAVVLALRSSASGNSPHLVESWLQDDQHLVYSPGPTVDRTLGILRLLGVDRVRVTVEWKAIAPSPQALTPPAGFDPSNPAAYAPAAWAPYDRVVELAKAHHVGIDFEVTGPGPLWANARGAPDAKTADHYYLSAAQFEKFVVALGRRYSGSYAPPVRPPGIYSPLPRVTFWSIWNEPNQPGWLSPQWGGRAGQEVMQSPRLYRGYVDAAFAALISTGHEPSADTIMAGEFAPEGCEGPKGCPYLREADPIPPMPFLRALYCVDDNYRPLSGTAASTLGCPSGGSRGEFVSAHPGLFKMTAFAHHPYEFFLAPYVSLSDPNYVPLADLGRLERGLDAIFSTYGVDRHLPLYLTEYGYETNPPNPYRGVTPQTQAAYLDQAQYMASKDPRVRAFTQFLLYDDLPNRRYPPGSVRYWSTFQTGLLYADGKPKPSLFSYPLPIFVPYPSFASGQPVLIWGMLRLAPNDTKQRALIQWRAAGGAFRTLTTATTSDPSGFLSASVKLPGPGSVRIVWVAPNNVQTYPSRSVAVR